MMNFLRKKAVQRSALLPAAALLVGLAGGTALAAITAHDDIVLRDYDGTKITLDAQGKGMAYSAKQTCFSTVENAVGSCHGSGSTGTLKFTYDDMEKHSYHAQNSANEVRGFNPWNPDAFAPDGTEDKFRRSVTPQGKNWVQSPGHIGSW